MNASAPQTTLARWLSGPRYGRLPDHGPEAAAPKLSFEFFPPRTDALEAQLWACIRRLEPLAPRFVSVTYGAGGSTQARTHATVARIVTDTTLTPAAHLTCVGASRGEIDDVARQYWDAGIRHIVALLIPLQSTRPHYIHTHTLAHAQAKPRGGIHATQTRHIEQHPRLSFSSLFHSHSFICVCVWARYLSFSLIYKRDGIIN